MTQQDIEQEIYRQRLVDYVMANSGKSESQAIDYLDSNCPRWREGSPPSAGVIEVEGVNEDLVVMTPHGKQQHRRITDGNHLYRRANIRHKRLQTRV